MTLLCYSQRRGWGKCEKLFDFLKMILEKAYTNDYISKNPLKSMDKPNHEKQNGVALSTEDQKILRAICKDIKNAEIVDVTPNVMNDLKETIAFAKKADVIGIDDDFRLQVRYEDGTTELLSSGEVSLRVD